jgi:NTP pyrophosphatase (non-canonical NTP hydrolase)
MHCKIRREFLVTTLDCPQCGQPLIEGSGAVAISPAEYERLAILMEECAEVIQAAAKIQRFGYVGFYHDGRGNREQLETELGQVNNIIRMMVEREDVDSSRILKAHHEKAMTIGKYLVHQ